MRARTAGPFIFGALALGGGSYFATTSRGSHAQGVPHSTNSREPTPIEPAAVVVRCGDGTSTRVAPQLGRGATVVSAAAGRYAVSLTRDNVVGCSRGSGHRSIRASMVLELREDGAVSACVGRRDHYSHDSIDTRYTTEMRERQGYRGRWCRDGAWLDLSLQPSPAVCAPLYETTNTGDRQGALPAPARVEWHLRCVGAQLPVDASVAVPLLACTLPAADYNQREAYDAALPEFSSPGLGLVFGRGAGVRVMRRSDWRESSDDSGPTLSAVPNATPIGFDDWTLRAAPSAM